MTLLMHAVAYGNVESLQFLLDCKACLDIKDEVKHALPALYIFEFDCWILMIG